MENPRPSLGVYVTRIYLGLSRGETCRAGRGGLGVISRGVHSPLFLPLSTRVSISPRFSVLVSFFFFFRRLAFPGGRG